MRFAFKRVLTTLFFLVVGTSLFPSRAPAGPYEALAKYQFGSSREPLAAIEAEIRKTPAAGYRDIENRLLAVLKSPATTKDAKRFICRWLGVVGSAECIPAVAELLTDEDLSHPARMALEPMKDPAAGAALRNALPKVKGKLLAGLIGSLGIRREAESVAPLARLTDDADLVVAEAAIHALGAIGSLQAFFALNRELAPATRLRAWSQAQMAAVRQSEGPGPVLLPQLMKSHQPKAIRTAAAKALIGILSKSEETVRIVVECLQGEDTALRIGATAAYVAAAKELKDAVAEQLPAMKPAGQLALLRVVADQPDVAARPAVVKILESSGDMDVRVAALECLIRHGEAADVPLAVRLANARPEAVAQAARRALQQMGKPGVDEALARLIESPKADERAVVLAVLTDRRVESGLPILVRLLGGADAAMAAEAAKGLGVLGKSEQLTALATRLLHPQSAAVRNAAEDAVKAICARAPDKQAAAKALLATLDQATTPAARSSVLRLLAYTRGEEALDAVRRAIEEPSDEVRETAIRTLVAWPDTAAAPYLIQLAKTTQKPAYAVLALRDGCLRLANLKDVPLAERVSIYGRVLEAAKRTEEKKQAIAGLAQVPSLGALELLQASKKDAALSSDATLAAVRLARQIGPLHPKQVAAALEDIKSQAASDDVKKEVEDALESLKNVGQSPDGFILAWLLSGPYVQEGKDGSALFNVPFAPEKPGAKAQWRPAVVPPSGKAGLVEIDKILGGNNRVSYLKTRITSSREQEALLQFGSDDGVKVWLNGQVVHANNAVRPCAPDQDKAKVRLKQGENTLLVKVTQSGGEWSVCCRLRAPDGKPLKAVSVAPGEP